MAPRGLRLDRTLGPLVAAWIESQLCHGPGDVQGQPIELDDEQVRFLFRCYELDDRGRRLIRRAVFSRAKGRAKSELGAMVACAEALGPVRFAGWDHDGKPLGRPVQAPGHFVNLGSVRVADAAMLLVRRAVPGMSPAAGLPNFGRSYHSGGGPGRSFSSWRSLRLRRPPEATA